MNLTSLTQEDGLLLENFETAENISDATTSRGNPRLPVPIAGKAMLVLF